MYYLTFTLQFVSLFNVLKMKRIVSEIERPTSKGSITHAQSETSTTYFQKKSLEADFLKKPNDKSTFRTLQSAVQNEYCYHMTLTPILQLLRHYGIILEGKNVLNTEISTSQRSLDGPRRSRIDFEIVLNTKIALPSRLSGKTIKENYPHKEDGIEKMTSYKFMGINNMEHANLIIFSKNNPHTTKSTIHTQLQIYIDENHLEPETNKPQDSDPDNVSKFFKKRNKTYKLKKFGKKSTYFGLVLALMASTLCGISFVLKKRSLLKGNKSKAYFQNRGWWMAHSLMVVGDILHFIAFFFAPAVLICTVQTLMVIVAAVSSIKILGEKINNYWKLAFASSLGGCLVIIVHVPKEPHITNIETFLYMIITPSFLAYIFVLFILTIIMIVFVIPKWGKINSLPYAVQSAIFGSVLVIALKGVIITVSDRFFHWLPFACLMVVAVCLLAQLEYLNRALSYYNTLVVTTQYYVLYSALVILGSSMLFDVWKTSTDETILLISLGFSTIALGVLIFAIFQEDNATFDFAKLFTGPDITYSD